MHLSLVHCRFLLAWFIEEINAEVPNLAGIHIIGLSPLLEFNQDWKTQAALQLTSGQWSLLPELLKYFLGINPALNNLHCKLQVLLEPGFPWIWCFMSYET